MKIERNSLCFCGSGKKYKKCCLSLDRELMESTSMLSEYQEFFDKTFANIEADDLLDAILEDEDEYNLYSDDHRLNFFKGAFLSQIANNKGAISLLEKVIQTDPHFSEAYFILGNLYRQEMKIPQSVACYRKVIEIEGEHENIGKLAGKNLNWLEKMIKKNLGETLEEHLKRAAFFDEAFECLRKEKFKEAISLFEQVLALNPNHVQSHGNIALAHSALGEHNIALQHLDKALLLDPTYEPAQHNRENIISLKEGEKMPFNMKEVTYYKEKLEEESKLEKKIQDQNCW